MTRFNLPDVEFAKKSAQEIEAEAVANYEGLTDIKLADADPRRKFIQSIVLLAVQQRSNINYSAKQNLLAYANGDFLDHQGVSTDTSRLPATASVTTLRFVLSVALEKNEIIPAGTMGTAGDDVFFATTEQVVVPAGLTQVDVEAICTIAGSQGNGYLPGQINQLVKPIRWVQSIQNVTTSEGGSDEEEDDAYADRIRQAPERFSVAGPDGAYRYWARTASPLIVDVSVDSPSPCVVEIRPLLKDGGVPGQEILDLVDGVCNDRKIRPLTDHVQVLAPEIVSYDISLTYWISTGNSSTAASIQANVQQALSDYKQWQKSKLGRSVDPSELIARIKNAGAKRVAVTLPAYKALSPYQVAVENTVAIDYGGLEDD
ncbi:baseplate J/gp47 family protein [Brevibacillus sp. DP1.3A]|uniref:baseplate assembly protein n=1 Tax=Brevibacillus sp. DP1.3A TaxID=2738867 RepID=UPI00156B35C3|nr:baseplate J/gp47 family protein [Brevibacillus sp. DP1.3A]UED76106.1 baseplate J/gp47 family protein [Brevibacillus sp. DP1.3A]